MPFIEHEAPVPTSLGGRARGREEHVLNFHVLQAPACLACLAELVTARAAVALSVSTS